MHELNAHEVEMISMDIEQQGLNYTPLQNELLDHVCCQIELMMEKGLTFNEAYRKVKADMGKKRVRQIQHETLSLISKKYRRMKRTMYVFGVAAPILLLAGITFKVFHWPGAGIVILISWSLVAVILLPILVLNQLKQKENKINNYIFIILLAVSVSILILAKVRSEPWQLLQGYHIPGQNLVSNAELLEVQSDQILMNAENRGSTQIVK
jgi:hypothetical protein